jgi:hypothetical protein
MNARNNPTAANAVMGVLTKRGKPAVVYYNQLPTKT